MKTMRLVYNYEQGIMEFNNINEMLKFLNDEVYKWDEDEIFEDEDFALDVIEKELNENNYFEFCDGDYVEYAEKPFHKKHKYDLN